MSELLYIRGRTIESFYFYFVNDDNDTMLQNTTNNQRIGHELRKRKQKKNKIKNYRHTI